MSRLPGVTPRRLIAALSRAGFIEASQRGSHRHFYHPQTGRKTTVPVHGADLKRGTLAAILKQTGLTVADL